MLFIRTLVSLALASIAVAQYVLTLSKTSPPSLTFPRTRVCGNVADDELRAKVNADFNAKRLRVQAKADVTIKVHWHVIQSGTTLAKGHVPYVKSSSSSRTTLTMDRYYRKSQITAQIDALNEAYSGTGLTYKLVNTVSHSIILLFGITLIFLSRLT